MRAVVIVLAVVAGLILVTVLSGLAPDVPQRCVIPGHLRTTVVECEGTPGSGQ